MSKTLKQLRANCRQAQRELAEAEAAAKLAGRRAAQPTIDAPTLLKLQDVQALLGVSRSSVLRLVDAHRFPAPIKIGERLSRWLASDVEDWIKQRASERKS